MNRNRLKMDFHFTQKAESTRRKPLRQKRYDPESAKTRNAVFAMLTGFFKQNECCSANQAQVLSAEKRRRFNCKG